MRIKMALILGLAASVALLAGCEKLKPIGARGSRGTSSGSGSSGGAAEAVSAGNKVPVTMFVMSQCPYGVQAVDGFMPVVKEIGAWIDWKLEYIVNEKDGKITSMHGDKELKGNIQQLCAQKLYPEQSKWTAFVACQNKNWRNIPAGWEPCAKEANMDVGKMRSCMDGNQGQELIKASMKVAQKAGAQGSPTIHVGGAEYSGGREKNDFMRAICAKVKGNKPPACAKIPEEPEVVATVISDKRCAKCDSRVKEVENIMKGRFFPKLKISARLDWSSSEAKRLYKELKLKSLPTMLFHSGAEKAGKFNNLKRFLSQNGKYWVLGGIGVTHDPTAEICDNKTDDTGNGKVDCADATCAQKLVCRTAIAKKLDVFIMSQCPFGVKAINAMKEVIGNFGNDLKFDVHFIADGDEKKQTSMHGQSEVDEDIRMLCAKKLYPRNYKWLDYYYCRFTGNDWRTEEWKKCAKGGIDAGAIQRCFDTEGKKLLAADLKMAKGLGIGASPTWLANNRHKFSGIAPEGIKTELCKHNPGMKNCDKKLTGTTAPVKGGCGN